MRNSTNGRQHSVFEVHLSNGSLTLHEKDAGESVRIYRGWLASLDKQSAALTRGKTSNDVALRVLELAESFLRNREIEKSVTVFRLVAEGDMFVGTAEHALAVAALKTLMKSRQGLSSELGVVFEASSHDMPSNNPRSQAQITEEEGRSLAHAASALGRRWRTVFLDAHERADYRGLGLSQYTIGNLNTALAKLGPDGLKKLMIPPPTRD